MPGVIHRTTFQYIDSAHYGEETDGPLFPTSEWLRDPDLSAVVSVDKKYWKVSGETVVEMSAPEKDAVDLNDMKAQYDTLIRSVARNVREYHIGDDFIGVDMDWVKWTNDKVGAASSITAMPLDHGQVRVRSGGTAGNYCALTNGLSAFRARHNVIVQTRVKCEQLVNFSCYIGFYKDASNKVEFSADLASGYWKALTVSGGVTTENTTAVPVDTAYHYFEIRASSVKVEFLIDELVVATHETNITPEIMYYRTVVARTGGSTTLDVMVDFIYIDGKRSEN